jgi:AcrR family transcriptional regulator
VVVETAAREPQQDRSRATRRRLLEAAVRCLAEHGWTGTTVAVVAESAGVSRGAAQHHFPTREDLVTAAVRHMTEVRMDDIRRHVAELPQGTERTEAVVDVLVRIYTGTVFRAALQLWVAASADEALRAQIVPVEAQIGREAHALALDLLGVDEATPGVRETVQATMDMARGLGLANLLTDDSKRRRRIVQQWARTLDAVLAAA